MSAPHDPLPAARGTLETHLLGSIDFDRALALEQRLVYEAGDRQAGAITLLVCEHPPLITIGRSGSRAHLRASSAELASRQIEIRWVNRGGGALMHAPGQLAVYPIVPLQQCGWTVGQFMRRFQAGLVRALADLGVAAPVRADLDGIWGRTGQLVMLAAAVKNWVTYQGAFINVAPSMSLQRLVESDFARRSPLSSLVLERQQAVKMSSVRSAVIERLAESFGGARHHLHTGHPLVAQILRLPHGSIRRAV